MAKHNTALKISPRAKTLEVIAVTQNEHGYCIETYSNLGESQKWVIQIRGNNLVLYKKLYELVGQNIKIPEKTIFERNQELAPKLALLGIGGSCGEQSYVGKICPFDALLLLSRNDNRLARGNPVMALCDEIERDDYIVTSQGIGIAATENELVGILTDGQHRLLSCLCSNTEIETTIVFDLTSEARAKTDRGKGRTPVDDYITAGNGNRHDRPNGPDLQAILMRVWVIQGNHESHWRFIPEIVAEMGDYWQAQLPFVKILIENDKKAASSRFSVASSRAAMMIGHRKYPEATHALMEMLTNPGGSTADLEKKPSVRLSDPTYLTMLAYLKGVKGETGKRNNGNAAACDPKTTVLYKILYLIRAYAENQKVTLGSLTMRFGGRADSKDTLEKKAQREDAINAITTELFDHYMSEEDRAANEEAAEAHLGVRVGYAPESTWRSGLGSSKR